jgi:aminopeptidase
MADERYQRLAHVLVSYSLAIQPGDRLLISAQPAARPLVREIYRSALQADAYPTVRVWLDAFPPTGLITGDSLFDVLLREGSADQMRYVSELDKRAIEGFDAYLAIMAEEDTRGLSDIDPQRIALFKQARADLRKRFYQKGAEGNLRWCGTLFPTPAHAQEADMSLGDYEDFVYSAGFLDQDDPIQSWRQLAREQQRIVDYLNRRDEIHILAPDTDVTLRTGGRTWINAHGKFNFPDGEVFTSPIEESVNGQVCFSHPAVYAGTPVEGVRLTFRDGKVVEASAVRGQAFLDTMLDQDPGARFVGEVAFGLNYNIKRFTRNIVFDEKIGGTMHLAVGSSYPEAGGQNQSALHWDMICDMWNGRVYADGQLCYQDGKFVI